MSEEIIENEESSKSIPRLFDINRPITIKLQTPAGVKTIDLRFPTDEEWIERQRRRKIIIKHIGRGMSETTVPESEEVDAELLAKLRTGDSPDVDPFEAVQILNQLSEAEVDNVAHESGGYRVFLRVPGAMTEHVLDMPSARDIIKYRRKASRVIDLRFNRQQVIVDPVPAADLYKQLKKETVGYASVVPVIHMAVVVNAVIEELESGIGVAGSENF